MVETGLLAYPMFGLSLTYQNNGSLSLGLFLYYSVMSLAYQ